MKEKNTVLWERKTEEANSTLAGNGHLTSQAKSREIRDYTWEYKEASGATLDSHELTIQLKRYNDILYLYRVLPLRDDLHVHQCI